MARITVYAVGDVKTSKNNNKYAVVEMQKQNGLLTKRVKGVFFEKDIDIDALSKAQKGDLLCVGEISTVKVAPYEITTPDGVRTVSTATILIPEGDEVDAILTRKKLERPAAPAAPVMTLESAAPATT